MKTKRAPQYFIVKHGLDALQVLPNYVWRTHERKLPSALKRIAPGDKWIGFAYTTSDARERPLSQITGFYECVQTARYGEVPTRALAIMGRGQNAWMVKGMKIGWQPPTPVLVPPIEELLGRRYFRQTTVVPIRKSEFARIRKYAQKHRLNPSKIPLLKREPRYEQEVLAIFACGHRQFGVEKILRIRTAFPDVLVKLAGKREPVHLELEVYASSFLHHGHAGSVDGKSRYKERLGGRIVRRPVALVCWVRDVPVETLRRKGGVSRVFELRSLLQSRSAIQW
jgi:hypothetical protein